MNHSWGGSQEEKNREPRIILAIQLLWLKGEKNLRSRERENDWYLFQCFGHETCIQRIYVLVLKSSLISRSRVLQNLLLLSYLWHPLILPLFLISCRSSFVRTFPFYCLWQCPQTQQEGEEILEAKKKKILSYTLAKCCQFKQ